MNSEKSPVYKAPQSQRVDINAHALSVNQVADLFEVTISNGLSPREATRRLKSYGLNQIEQKQGRRWWHLIHAQFTSIVIWLLASASIVAWFTGNILEALAILVVLILNAVIGYTIELQAGRAIDALKKAARTTALVRRRNRQEIIDAINLVPGDIVLLTAGERVPADLRILEATNVHADESTLTGESVSVEKKATAVNSSTPLAERSSMLYVGTTIVSGHALSIVTATANQTELGRIGQLVAEAETGQTPLQKRLEDLGKRLVYLVLGIALIVFLGGYLRGDEFWLMLEVSISLAVAAVPEGLPAVTTLILALGILRMARSNAIVRRLAAVETLGSSTIICTDKTGTLTENRMTVQEYRLANGRLVKPLNKPEESLSKSFELDKDGVLSDLLLASILCNEATFDSNAAEENQAIGDPTETALLTAAYKLGTSPEKIRSAHNLIHELPFDSEAKYMVSVHKPQNKPAFAAMKGAPAVVLDTCTYFAGEEGKLTRFDSKAKHHFLEINREMANRTLRILAFAKKEINSDPTINSNKIEKGYTFLGFVGMSDPPRRGAAEAVGQARRAGIRVVMLTGDQINTAQAIARELKLNGDDDIFALHSNDIVEAKGEKLAEMANQAHVFARVSPEDKLNIVNALQNVGEIVAVTGDGVNDAPALKQADIGIAMGKRGTEVAKEASDIILTDDNFVTIIEAIRGGRAIYANIIRFVHMMFSHNLGEIVVIFVAIASGLPLPLLPLQILWINLVTDVFPALALAVEPPSPDTMDRKPHSPKESLLSARFLFLIGWQGVMLGAITLGAYLWALESYGAGAHSRTVVLLSLIGVQLGHLFNCRSRTRSTFTRFFTNPYIFAAALVVVILQMLAIYFTPLARILDTVRPNMNDLVVIVISIILPVVVVEITKVFARLSKKRNSNFIRA